RRGTPRLPAASWVHLACSFKFYWRIRNKRHRPEAVPLFSCSVAEERPGVEGAVALDGRPPDAVGALAEAQRIEIEPAMAEAAVHLAPRAAAAVDTHLEAARQRADGDLRLVIIAGRIVERQRVIGERAGADVALAGEGRLSRGE